MEYAVCAALVEKGDPDRFLATMAAPPELRGGLFTLAAYNLELARAPWASKEPMIAEMRLQWWRDLIEDIAAGRARQTHEISDPLGQTIGAFQLSPRFLDEMAAARLWDCYAEPFADQEDFDGYIDHTAGHLMWMACQTLGAQAQDEAAVRAYAYGVGVANWLAAVADLVDRGKIPLLDGRDAGVKTLAQKGLESLHAAKPSREFAPALRWGWQADPLLKLALKQPERVGEGRLYLPDMPRKGRLFRKALLGRY